MYNLHCNGLSLDLSTPVVMGILNLTGDSFYDGGMHASLADRLTQAEKMLHKGASLIDVGAVSTRQGRRKYPRMRSL